MVFTFWGSCTINPAFADKSEGGGVPRSPLKTPPKTMIVSFFGGFVCKKDFGTRGLNKNKIKKSKKYMNRDPGGSIELAERIFFHLTRAP